MLSLIVMTIASTAAVSPFRIFGTLLLLGAALIVSVRPNHLA
jgi:hypothetical protein